MKQKAPIEADSILKSAAIEAKLRNPLAEQESKVAEAEVEALKEQIEQSESSETKSDIRNQVCIGIKCVSAYQRIC